MKCWETQEERTKDQSKKIRISTGVLLGPVKHYWVCHPRTRKGSVIVRVQSSSFVFFVLVWVDSLFSGKWSTIEVPYPSRLNKGSRSPPRPCSPRSGFLLGRLIVVFFYICMSLPTLLGWEKYTIHIALLGEAEEVPVRLVIVLVIRSPNFFGEWLLISHTSSFWRVIVDFPY